MDREETLVAALADFGPDPVRLPPDRLQRAARPDHLPEAGAGHPLHLRHRGHGRGIGGGEYLSSRGQPITSSRTRLARLPGAAQRALRERRVIAERSQAQAALGASEEGYHQLFEAMSSGEVVAVYEDVSERMVHEAQIDRLNRTRRTVSACNRDMVRTRCKKANPGRFRFRFRFRLVVTPPLE